MADSARGGWADPTFAARYDATFGQFVAPTVAKALLRAAAPQPGEGTLECACGAGALTLPLAEALGGAATVVCADLSAAMVALAATKPRVAASATPRFTVQDMQALGCRTGRFDLVACSLAFQIVPDKGRALREAWRVLRPGGRLAFAVPGDWSVEPFWTVFWERVTQPDARAALRVEPRRWTPDAIAATVAQDRDKWLGELTAAGFERVAISVEPGVVWYPSVELFLANGPFGHIGRAQEMIEGEEIRERVFQDIARTLQQGKSSHGLPIDIAVLCAVGYRPGA